MRIEFILSEFGQVEANVIICPRAIDSDNRFDDNNSLTNLYLTRRTLLK